MRRFLSWRKIAVFLALILTVALLLSYEYILRQIGHFLVFEQGPQRADVIVVLNGRDTERALAAVDLYTAGYAKLIVMARAAKQPGSDDFWKRVDMGWNSKIFFQRAIEAMGIPENAFKLIGDGITSTYDEAKTTAVFLRQNGWESVLLVTSKWHSKRAYCVFRSAFKSDRKIRITVCPSKYDSFEPSTWWKTEMGAELVLREYVRLIYYLFTGRISPLTVLL